MFYMRRNKRVCFLLPLIAIGIDVDDRVFFEFGFLTFVIGIGDAP
jgi:hypothetical protein